MKNTIIGTLAGIALGATGTVLTTDTVNPNPIILKQNVELHSRLNEPVVWDVSVVTADELSQAYIDTAEKFQITESEIYATDGNIQTAIQVELQKQGLMCSK